MPIEKLQQLQHQHVIFSKESSIKFHLSVDIRLSEKGSYVTAAKSKLAIPFLADDVQIILKKQSIHQKRII